MTGLSRLTTWVKIEQGTLRLRTEVMKPGHRTVDNFPPMLRNWTVEDHWRSLKPPPSSSCFDSWSMLWGADAQVLRVMNTVHWTGPFSSLISLLLFLEIGRVFSLHFMKRPRFLYQRKGLLCHIEKTSKTKFRVQSMWPFKCLNLQQN